MARDMMVEAPRNIRRRLSMSSEDAEAVNPAQTPSMAADSNTTESDVDDPFGVEPTTVPYRVHHAPQGSTHNVCMMVGFSRFHLRIDA